MTGFFSVNVPSSVNLTTLGRAFDVVFSAGSLVSGGSSLSGSLLSLANGADFRSMVDSVGLTSLLVGAIESLIARTGLDPGAVTGAISAIAGVDVASLVADVSRVLSSIKQYGSLQAINATLRTQVIPYARSLFNMTSLFGDLSAQLVATFSSLTGAGVSNSSLSISGFPVSGGSKALSGIVTSAIAAIKGTVPAFKSWAASLSASSSADAIMNAVTSILSVADKLSDTRVLIKPLFDPIRWFMTALGDLTGPFDVINKIDGFAAMIDGTTSGAINKIEGFFNAILSVPVVKSMLDDLGIDLLSMLDGIRSATRVLPSVTSVTGMARGFTRDSLQLISSTIASILDLEPHLADMISPISIVSQVAGKFFSISASTIQAAYDALGRLDLSALRGASGLVKRAVAALKQLADAASAVFSAGYASADSDVSAFAGFNLPSLPSSLSLTAPNISVPIPTVSFAVVRAAFTGLLSSRFSHLSLPSFSASELASDLSRLRNGLTAITSDLSAALAEAASCAGVCTSSRRLQSASANKPVWSFNGLATMPAQPAQPFPLRLLAGEPAARAAAFRPISLPASFGLNFSFTVRPPTGGASSASSPAEGLTLTFHRDSRGSDAIGDSQPSSCMGYCGISPSYGMRFDLRGSSSFPKSTFGFHDSGFVLGEEGEGDISDVSGGDISSWTSGTIRVDVSYAPESGLTVGMSRVGTDSRVEYVSAVDLHRMLDCPSPLDGPCDDAFVGFTSGSSSAGSSIITIGTFLSTVGSGSATVAYDDSPEGSAAPSPSPSSCFDAQAILSQARESLMAAHDQLARAGGPLAAAASAGVSESRNLLKQAAVVSVWLRQTVGDVNGNAVVTDALSLVGQLLVAVPQLAREVPALATGSDALAIANGLLNNVTAILGSAAGGYEQYHGDDIDLLIALSFLVNDTHK